MSSIIEPTLDTDAADAARGLTRVVVPTDVDDERLDLARRVATRLAAEHGWSLVLYDRSGERWTDTPHPSGPHTAGALDADEREALIRQMRDIEAAGVEVTAWLATVPAISAMLDVIQQLDVDGVVMPSAQDDPKLLDRLLEGSDPAELVDRVVENQLHDAPSFLVVDDEGTVRVERYHGDAV